MSYLLIISIFFLLLLVAFALIQKMLFQNIANKLFEENRKKLLEESKEEFKSLRSHTNEDLETKKVSIEKQLSLLKDELKSLRDNTTALKTDLSHSKDTLGSLTQITNDLNAVLSNNQKRGQWGERQAEDLLQHFDLQEGTNYEKQASESGARPDFTFKLPKGKRLNMDVKYPIKAYQAYLQVDSKNEQEQHLKQFINDVKTHIKTIAKRKYINPAEGTLDYCLMFVSNEGIFQFINQQDEILDLAKGLNIVLCGPTSLFAILSLIRQSVKSFQIEEKAKSFQKEFERFQNEWENYKGKINSVEEKFGKAQEALDEARGTRTRALEKPLQKILEHEFKEDPKK